MTWMKSLKQADQSNGKIFSYFFIVLQKLMNVNNIEKTSGTTWLSPIQVLKEMQKF